MEEAKGAWDDMRLCSGVIVKVGDVCVGFLLLVLLLISSLLLRLFMIMISTNAADCYL
jgi:hypothetical protein